MFQTAAFQVVFAFPLDNTRFSPLQFVPGFTTRGQQPIRGVFTNLVVLSHLISNTVVSDFDTSSPFMIRFPLVRPPG